MNFIYPLDKAVLYDSGVINHRESFHTFLIIAKTFKYTPSEDI